MIDFCTYIIYTFSHIAHCSARSKSEEASKTLFFAGRPIFTQSSMKSLLKIKIKSGEIFIYEIKI